MTEKTDFASQKLNIKTKHLVNLILGDFNYDGKIDAITMTQEGSWATAAEIKMNFYPGNGKGEFGT